MKVVGSYSKRACAKPRLVVDVEVGFEKGVVWELECVGCNSGEMFAEQGLSQWAIPQ